MNIGEKLFELRKEKNLSQEEVAEKLNVTRQTVSKWETNQSTPDFDKIIPLCELFGIGAEELLTGKKTQEKQENILEEPQIEKGMTKEEARRKSAEVVSTSVFICVIAVALFTVAVATLNFDPVIATAMFLVAIGFASARLVRHYMSVPKFEETKEDAKEKEIVKQMNGIIGTFCTVLYFIVSFTTMAWHVTWIIFVIEGLLCHVVKLLFMLKEEKSDEK